MFVATATSIFSIGAFAGSLILGGLSYALTPKPKKNSNTDAATGEPGTVAVRQSDLTRSYVYGHTRVVRGYAQMTSTNSNQDLHLILMLCQGELRAINEIWADDYCIPNDWINADGLVTQGRYANVMTIRKHLGAPDQAADTLAVTNIPDWTVDHRLQGIAYLYIIMNKNQDIYPTGVPNITAIVEGQPLYDPRVDAPRWSTNIALYAYDYITAGYGFAANTADVDLVNIAAQANICDEIVTVNEEDFTVSAIDTSTNIIKLEGDLLTLQFGDQVQVSSTGSLPTGISGATNYYVIPYQIKTTPRILLAATLEDAMAKTAIDITTAGSGTITVSKNGEPRYHGGGTFDTSANLSETLNNIVTAMAGRAINIAGGWTVLAGAWRTPALELTIDDMRGTGISWKNCLSMSDSYNIVKGLFNGAPTLYQDSDYPAARYSTFIDQDLGIEAIKELNQPFTTRPTTAQRIAKIELFRGRQDIAVTCDFSMKAMLAQPGDVIELTMARLGWVNKEFEITESALDISEKGAGVKLTLRETAEEIYDWSAGEAIDFDPAPNTIFTNPFDVVVPTGVAYNSRFVETRDGDAIYTLQLQWTQHPDAFVREFGDFEIRFRLSDPLNGDDDNWLPSFFVDGELIKTDVLTASIGTPYDLGIRARNNLGVRSAWVTLLNVIVGSSGGVTDSEDWLFVTGTPDVFNDWGNVYDTPDSDGYLDWGFVL